MVKAPKAAVTALPGMALLISRLKSVSDADDTFLGMSILDFASYNAGVKL
jgi:hypothetical protein